MMLRIRTPALPSHRAHRWTFVVAGWLAVSAIVARADESGPASMTVATRRPLVPIQDEAPSYFLRHAEGWFWYRDPEPEPEPEPDIAPKPPPASPPADEDDPVQRIEVQRKTLEVALSRAILQPTPDNMKTYLRLNQQLMAQAGNFAEAWRGLIWSEPALDYSLVSPVGASAYVKADQDATMRDQRLAAASQRWGLVFFFRGSCPYCHQFAPLLKQFAQRYGFGIVDVSLDGGGLPEFPHPKSNDRAADALGVEAVPAVYLVEPSSRRVVPATFGLVGWTELVERVIHALDRAERPDPLAGAELSLGASP